MTASATRWRSRATRSLVSAPTDAVGANAGQGSAYRFARTGAPTRSATAKLWTEVRGFWEVSLRGGNDGVQALGGSYQGTFLIR